MGVTISLYMRTQVNLWILACGENREFSSCGDVKMMTSVDFMRSTRVIKSYFSRDQIEWVSYTRVCHKYTYDANIMKHNWDVTLWNGSWDMEQTNWVIMSSGYQVPRAMKCSLSHVATQESQILLFVQSFTTALKRYPQNWYVACIVLLVLFNHWYLALQIPRPLFESLTPSSKPLLELNVLSVSAY